MSVTTPVAWKIPIKCSVKDLRSLEDMPHVAWNATAGLYVVLGLGTVDMDRGATILGSSGGVFAWLVSSSFHSVFDDLKVQIVVVSLGSCNSLDLLYCPSPVCMIMLRDL